MKPRAEFQPGADGAARSLLVFVHVPKTAGTTFNAILADRFRAERIHEVMMRGMSLRLPQRRLLPPPLLSASKIRRLKSALAVPPGVALVNGHLDMSLAPHLPADARYMTLLRRPVPRAISHYHHYQRMDGDPLQALAQRSTLAEWVGRCGLAEMDNGQTRRLAGVMAAPIGSISARTLGVAKDHLARRFALVGLTERFEEFQVLLYRRLGWPYRRYAARNVGIVRPERRNVDAATLELIAASNRYDAELYDFAEELFAQAIRYYDMEAELAALRAAPLQGGDVQPLTPAQPAPPLAPPLVRAA